MSGALCRACGFNHRICECPNPSAVATLPGAGAAGSASPTRHCRPILARKDTESGEDFHNDIIEPAGFNHGENNGG